MDNLKITQIESVTATELVQQIKDEVKTLLSQPTPPPTQRLLTRKETAEYLGVSLVTLHNWNKKGILTPHRIGNQIRYKEGEILQALQSINNKKAVNEKG